MESRSSMRAAGLGPIVLWLALVACHSTSTIPQLDRRPLYQQLGGVEGIERLADRFLRELAADPVVRGHFKGIDARRFRSKLAEHLCEVADGPCEYTGDSMLEVHRGMDIDRRAFNAVVEDLIRAMESLRIPTPAQNRLLARLAPMRPDIVTKQARERYPPEPDSSGVAP